MIPLPKAVLFDLDGTLIHSAPDLQAAANHVCRLRSFDPFDLETIISFVGNGVPKLVERVFNARHRTPDAAELEKAVEDFLEFYNAHSTDLTRPYDHVDKALEWLASRNIPMAVVTNKPEAPARDIVQELGLDQWFSVIVGGDTVASKKPDPAPYQRACEELGVSASETVYVGDSETDAKTAVAAGVPFALYLHGYRNAAAEEIPHTWVIDSFAEFHSIFAEL